MLFNTSLSSGEGFSKTSYKIVKVKELYALSLPYYLEKTSGLSTTASLQYRNLTKKLLVIVVDEEKLKMDSLMTAFTPADYYDHVARQVAQKLDEAVIEKPSAKVIGTCNALQGGIDGKFLGTPLRYIIEIVESKTHYYQIICWTEEASISDVGNDIHLIINSFKELK